MQSRAVWVCTRIIGEAETKRVQSLKMQFHTIEECLELFEQIELQIKKGLGRIKKKKELCGRFMKWEEIREQNRGKTQRIAEIFRKERKQEAKCQGKEIDRIPR